MTFVEWVLILATCLQQLELMMLFVVTLLCLRRTSATLNIVHALTESHLDLTRAVKQRARASDVIHEKLKEDVIQMGSRRA